MMMMSFGVFLFSFLLLTRCDRFSGTYAQLSTAIDSCVSGREGRGICFPPRICGEIYYQSSAAATEGVT